MIMGERVFQLHLEIPPFKATGGWSSPVFPFKRPETQKKTNPQIACFHHTLGISNDTVYGSEIRRENHLGCIKPCK